MIEGEWPLPAGVRVGGRWDERATNFWNPAMRIQGETPARGSRLVAVVLFGVFMSPLLAIGGVLLQMAMENEGKFAIGVAVAGFCFLGLWFFLLWYMGVRIPGAEVMWFELDGENLVTQTVGRGEIRVSIQDVMKCQRKSGRTSGLLGWWIQFRDDGWVYISKDNPSAGRLVDHLEKLLRRQGE